MLPAADLLKARQTRVRAAFIENRLDALVVVHLPNVRYLTGFGGSAALAVLTRDELVFITDGRYVTEVEASVAPHWKGFRLVSVDPNYDTTLVRVLEEAGIARVGFEAAYLPVKRFNWLTAALEARGRSGGRRVDLVPTERHVEAVRLCKDDTERDTFRRAGAMLDVVAAEILASLKPDQVERNIAAEIDGRLKRGGFDKPAFDTIVASGPNAALPHARPGDRALGRGDLVVLDFGGVYDGYCVDLTRTVTVGRPDAAVRRLYAAVAEAQSAALASVRPGVPVSEVDAAARAVLVGHGFGSAFSHATGHGLGLEVHEEPRVGPRHADVPGVPPAGRDEILAPGMVMTIEPGAYVPGLGGVRIEDDVLVTSGGSELLTHVTRDLLVV